MNSSEYQFFPEGSDFNRPPELAHIQHLQQQLAAQKKKDELSFITVSAGLMLFMVVAVFATKLLSLSGEAVAMMWSVLLVMTATLSWNYFKSARRCKEVARVLSPANAYDIRALNNAQRRHPEVSTFLDAVAEQGRMVTHAEFLMLMEHLSHRDRVSNWLNYARLSPYHVPMSVQQIRVLRDNAVELQGERALFIGGWVSMAGIAGLVCLKYASGDGVGIGEQALVLGVFCSLFWAFLQWFIDRLVTFSVQLKRTAVSDDVGGVERVLFELKKSWPREIREYLEQVAQMKRPLLQDEIYMLAEIPQRQRG